jgi:hypothetical protein
LERNGVHRNLPNTVVTPLPPLECVARYDLIDFIRRHSIYVPPRWLNRYLDDVLRKTAGQYEGTLQELEQAVIEGYAQWQAEADQDEAEHEDEAEEEDDDLEG